jgi:membrane-bound lytic murein transglycosylase D
MRRLFVIFILLIGFLQLKAQDDYIHEIVPDVTYELVADRLKCLEQTIPLNLTPKVQSFIDYFTVRNRDYTRDIIAKKNLFFPIFEEELAKQRMPDELKYLAIIESGLRPNAISRAGAGGLWQFMPSTGKMYGLKQTWYIDERMNPEQSTEAALKYLKQLYRTFGDWELALAAYNTGPGNVRKAIRRSGYKDTFWEIYRFLPRETRSYVPQFVAMIYTLNYAVEHNIDIDNIEMEHQLAYDTVHVSDYMHLETLANQLTLCIDDLVKLNPQIIRGAIPDGVKNYPLKIPVDLSILMKRNRQILIDSASKIGKKELAYLARNSPGATYGKTKQIYRVRNGDVLGTIAQRFHVRISDIKKWNRLNSNMIYIGQRLNIWVLPHFRASKESAYTVKKAVFEPKIVPGGTYHVVQSGDSLWSIARQYKDVSIEQLKKLNNLSTSRIDPGQKLLINM